MNTSSFHRWSLAAAGLCFAALASAGLAASGGARSNVLFIMADDYRPDEKDAWYFENIREHYRGIPHRSRVIAMAAIMAADREE